MTEASRDPEEEAFEGILAACLERYTQEGAAALQASCQEHPELADRLVAQFERLERLGMLARDSENQAPSTFGRYRVLDQLGQGGMGVVYLVHDERLNRRVALKAAHAPLPFDGRRRERFEREIRAFAHLKHPGIVPVFDVGEEGGRPYFTMEYVEGATLSRVIDALKTRHVSFEEIHVSDLMNIVQLEPSRHSGSWGKTYIECACRFVLDVAEALSHAHQNGVIHRDVKPSNVMIRTDGRAQLFDLGLARLQDQAELTLTGDFAGTPHYVSPEQIEDARAVDSRTDVFSLGVTLYELLTLERPFAGDTPAQVFKNIHDREAPVLRQKNALIPRDLETICLNALEKDPAHRYASMDALARDLRRFLAFQPVEARRIGWLRRSSRFMRRNPALASAIVLGVLVAVGLPTGLFSANRAIRVQRDIAQASAMRAGQEAALSDAVCLFLVDMYQLTPEESGLAEEVSAREFLDRAVERIHSGFEDDPTVRAALLDATGRAYHNLGLSEKALPLLDRSFALRQRELGENHPDVASVLHALARVHLDAGNIDVAIALAQRGVNALRGAEVVDLSLLGEASLTLSEAHAQNGAADLAGEALALALEPFEAASEPRLEVEAEMLERLALLAAERGELELARARLVDAMEIRRRLWNPDPTAFARNLERLRRLEQGERISGEVVQAADVTDRRHAVVPSAHSLQITDLLPPWRGEYEQSFQAGITALQASQHELALQAFDRCRELDPNQRVTAYNTACAYSLIGDNERALDWLSRAAELGFGTSTTQLASASRTDVDLAGLRADPRSRAIFERMKAAHERGRAFSEVPALYMPEGLQEPFALLIVLHAPGRTKDDIVEGEWRQLAEELGCVLLAPSGTVPCGENPSEGMLWSPRTEELLERPMLFEDSITRAVRELFEEYRIDRERVVLVGEGEASLLAFDLAVRAPGLFRAALLYNGPPRPDITRTRVENAARAGLRVRVLYGRDAPVRGWPIHLAPRISVSKTRTWLAAHGLSGESALLDGEAGADLRNCLLTLLDPLKR